MPKLLYYSCLLIGSLCLGIGGALLISGILFLESLFCLMLSAFWFISAESGWHYANQRGDRVAS
ncbi:MAG: hypothetical protein AAF558_14570 [Verrucomicrobiota bacterium]